VPICSFCPLLCEFVAGEGIECSLREQTLASLVNIEHDPSALVDGRKVSVEMAIQKANEFVLQSNCRTITGTLRSVEGSRAVLALASRLNAFVTPSNSESAFKSIPAIQRSGMVTASLSEVRFRADCIVLIGDDRTLDGLPRLANILFERLATHDASQRKLPRVVLLGKWSAAGLAHIRQLGVDVSSVDIDIDKIPQSLFQWSRCNRHAVSASRNVASNWMSEANYLTLIWSPVVLQMPHADLWIERLFEWIDQRNEQSRCVGFPLANDYVTFQQVCTWITGFPGRVQVNGEEFRYEPRRILDGTSEGSSEASINIQADEFVGGFDGDLSDANNASNKSIAPAIVISPKLEAREPMPRVFIPCGVPGVDHTATFFRVDATVAVEAKDEVSLPRSSQPMSLVEILGKIFVCFCMVCSWAQFELSSANRRGMPEAVSLRWLDTVKCKEELAFSRLSLLHPILAESPSCCHG
jgi:formylmethanofuran dehydrogenase subunit B